MTRTWIFPFVIALSAILGGCGKGGSSSVTGASDASASQAPDQASQAASGAAASGTQAAGTLGSIKQAQLPGEAGDTLRLIKAGGPYPFGEDGVLFRNTAAILPQHPRGYYHTYTVRTPGVTTADRGQRRIVCGGPRKQTSDCYYTDDYYASFKRIAQ